MKKNMVLSIIAIAIVIIGGWRSFNIHGLAGENKSTSAEVVNLLPEEEMVGIAEHVDEIIGEVQKTGDIPMVELPSGIKGLKAESVPNKELKNLIIEYMEIPEDFYEATHYYYNYVDLDNDGTKEIFVMVTGPYTSGTGGSSALWVSENAGKLHVVQNFTLVNEPIIISDTIKNGFHELVVPYYGGEKSQYSVLSYQNGEYLNVPDGKIIDTLDGITGTAIIANDIIKEVEAGTMRFNLISE